jgi:DNA-binding transcriptional ArsR family regulator
MKSASGVEHEVKSASGVEPAARIERGGDLEQAARVFQALGDCTRLALLRELRDGERTVGDLVRALGEAQPKISQHLKVLRDAGVVEARRDGRQVWYGLNPIPLLDGALDHGPVLDRRPEEEGAGIRQRARRTNRGELETHLL